MTESVQERYARSSICFGCGPANQQGLRIRSFPEGDGLVATFTPAPHHEAFPGMLNGGILGALLDCHGNWAAAMHFLSARGLEAPPCCVTAEFAIALKRPTPSDAAVQLVARVVSTDAVKALVEGTLTSVKHGKLCATLRGTFVAVQPGHPAFHRWG